MVWDMLAAVHCFIPIGLEPIVKIHLTRAAPFLVDLNCAIV
jgi:hypothetical protein